jgi:hypothetical protein
MLLQYKYKGQDFSVMTQSAPKNGKPKYRKIINAELNNFNIDDLLELLDTNEYLRLNDRVGT